MGRGGIGDCLRFFTFVGRICCTVMGVVASLELQSSNSGVEGCVDSTARYWHTAKAAAWRRINQSVQAKQEYLVHWCV